MCRTGITSTHLVVLDWLLVTSYLPPFYFEKDSVSCKKIPVAEFGKASPPHLGIYQSNSVIIYWDLGVQVSDILDAPDMIKRYPDWIHVCYVCHCFVYSLVYILGHHLFVYDLRVQR